MLRFLFSNKKTTKEQQPACSDQIVLQDYLGKAASSGRKAKEALKSKNYDLAWRYYNEQQSYYHQHINRSGSFSKKEVLRLDASVSEDFANVLRLEKKHDQALVHIIYWISASASWPIKRHQQKLEAYFNRCRFKKPSQKTVRNFIKEQNANPDFRSIQNQISLWRIQEKDV